MTVRTAKELMDSSIPKISYLVNDIIPRESICIVAGPPKSFKSNLLLYLALCGTTGEKVLSYDVENKFTTLYIDEENRDIGMKDKLEHFVRRMPEADLSKLYITSDSKFIMSSKEKHEWLCSELERLKPDLVIIDSISKVFVLDERNEQDVKKLYLQFGGLVQKYHTTFIFIHHCRKKNFLQNSRDLEDISGSREFGAACDSVILLEDKGKSCYNLKQVASRYSSKAFAIQFEVISDVDETGEEYFYIVSKGAVRDSYIKKADLIAEEIKHWFEEANLTKKKRSEIIKEMVDRGYSESNIKNALQKLVNDTYFERNAFGEFVRVG